MPKPNIPLKTGTRVTHVSNERCLVGVIVHERKDGSFDVHWQMPPWISDRNSRGCYTTDEIKRTYVKEKEIKQKMLEIYGWNMTDAFAVE